MTTAQYVILGLGGASLLAVLAIFRKMPNLSSGVAEAPAAEPASAPVTPKGMEFVEDLAPPPAQREAIVVEVADDDPRMLAAVAEARRRWPEFVQAFNRRKPNQSFSVKLPFRDVPGGEAEFMWVEVIRIDGNEIHGSLMNQPVFITTKTLHDSVEARVHEVNDWVYTQEGESIGGFTGKVLDEAERQAEEEQRKSE